MHVCCSLQLSVLKSSPVEHAVLVMQSLWLFLELLIGIMQTVTFHYRVHIFIWEEYNLVNSFTGV